MEYLGSIYKFKTLKGGSRLALILKGKPGPYTIYNMERMLPETTVWPGPSDLTKDRLELYLSKEYT